MMIRKQRLGMGLPMADIPFTKDDWEKSREEVGEVTIIHELCIINSRKNGKQYIINKETTFTLYFHNQNIH